MTAFDIKQISVSEIVLFLFSIGIALYIIFIGYILVLLWRYQGRLGPQPTKYTILTEDLQERIRKRAEEQAQSQAITLFPAFSAIASSIAGLGYSSNATTIAEDADNELRHRYKQATLSDLTDMEASTLIRDEDIEEIEDAALREYIREEQRISSLPVFEQDDCGDGSQFPDIPTIDPKAYPRPTSSLSSSSSRQTSSRSQTPLGTLRHPAFRSEPGNYMTMGLKKLDPTKWLIHDHREFLRFHDARKTLLRSKLTECVRVLPDGEPACIELFELVMDYLTTEYPDTYTITEFRGQPLIKNHLSRDEFAINPPYGYVHPLEICARLAMEDFNILQQSEFTGKHNLVASATLFPAGWSLSAGIGKSVEQLHGRVPMWGDKLSVPVEHYFNRLSNSRGEDRMARNAMQRSTFFIQIDPRRSRNPPEDAPLHELLFIQKGEDFFPGNVADLKPECILIRRERQTFRKLPKTGCIVFTVRTTLQRLTDLPKHERPNMLAEINSWDRGIAERKGRDIWGRVVAQFCGGTLDD